MRFKPKPLSRKDYGKILREELIHFVTLGLLFLAGLFVLGGMPTLLSAMLVTFEDPTIPADWGALSGPFVIAGILGLIGGGVYLLAVSRGWISPLKKVFPALPWIPLIYGIIGGMSSIQLYLIQLRIPNYPHPQSFSYYVLCFALSGIYIGLGLRLLYFKKETEKRSPMRSRKVKWTLGRVLLFLFGVGNILFFGFPAVFLAVVMILGVFPGPPDRFFPYVFYGVPMLYTGIAMAKKARKPFKKEIEKETKEYEESEETRRERDKIAQLTKEVERFRHPRAPLSNWITAPEFWLLGLFISYRGI